MTERTRRRLVDLSVIATSALVFAGGIAIAAEVDGARPRTPSAPMAQAAATPPVAGLAPAPRPARRVVVVRRSRPS